MQNPKVKKIVAIMVGIAVFIGLVYAYFAIFGTKAADLAPQDVIVSNIDKNSVHLSWTTGVATQGVVEYGTTPTALNFFAPEATKNTSKNIDLTLLSPGTTYYFDIRIGDTKYDNGGVPWTFSTKGADASVASPTAAATKIVPTQSVTQPTPVQHLVVSDGTNCTQTDCATIKTLLGKGCSTQDYFKCLNKSKITPTP